MNKTLDITNPTVKRLAEIALFEQVQAYFSLYPGRMADDIEGLAQRDAKDPIQLVSELKDQSIREFNSSMGYACMKFIGGDMEDHAKLDINQPYSKEIKQYFKLSYCRIASDFKSKSRALGMDTVSALKAVHDILPTIIIWAFDSTSEILKHRISR